MKTLTFDTENKSKTRKMKYKIPGQQTRNDRGVHCKKEPENCKFYYLVEIIVFFGPKIRKMPESNFFGTLSLIFWLFKITNQLFVIVVCK